ncbi:hypothetical protein BS17DRAFT_769008 [Gyrodon lividus]|nr:hypothetical protein BS17DRAFT_769008 [Gyrodon lividus]
MVPLLVFRKLAYGTCIILSLVTLGISTTWESKLSGDEGVLFPADVGVSGVTSVVLFLFLSFGQFDLGRVNWVVQLENTTVLLVIAWIFTATVTLLIPFPIRGGKCQSLYFDFGEVGIISFIIGGLLLFLQIAIVQYVRHMRFIAMTRSAVIHIHLHNLPPAPVGVPAMPQPPDGYPAGNFSPGLLYQQQGTTLPLNSSYTYPPSPSAAATELRGHVAWGLLWFQNNSRQNSRSTAMYFINLFVSGLAPNERVLAGSLIALGNIVDGANMSSETSM